MESSAAYEGKTYTSISNPHRKGFPYTIATMKTHSIILALDLESTLISNAISQFPRPGLYPFLEFCQASFHRLLIYTAVPEPVFRKVACQLVSDGHAPPWFANIQHLHCTGRYKDLRIVDTAIEHIFLIDDLELFVHPDQKDRWIPIAPFSPPYSSSDRELERLTSILKQLIS